MSVPYNFKRGLNTYLKAQRSSGAHQVKGSYRPEIAHTSRTAASQLIDVLFTKGADLDGTWTSADDWRIHIDPRGVGGRITDIVSDGHIFVSGTLPNVVLNGNIYMPYYEWKTGHRMMPAPEPSEKPNRER